MLKSFSHFLSSLILVFASMQPLNAVYINRYTTINNGYISFTGNTLQLSKEAGQNQPGSLGSGGAFITINPASQVGSYPASALPEAGTTLLWQNGSSSAVLDLPEGSNVLYAELIWSGSYGFGGEIPYNPSNPGAFLPNTTSVSITSPQLVTSTVAPDPATAQQATTPGFTNMGNYVRSQNVTSIIQAGGPGVYVVGGVPATIIGSDDSHNAAGWTLAVVYENPSMLTSNLTLFVGCEQASNNNPPAQVSGFCAPPSGIKNARLFVSAIEGDYSISGDQMRFGPTNSLTASDALSGTYNPVNNFFLSYINTLLPMIEVDGRIEASGSSLLDSRGSYGLKNFPVSGSFPNNFARQGYDITSIDVSNRIAYNQTVAYAQGTTSGDDYTINALGIQITVGSPVLNFSKTVNNETSIVAALGDTLTFDFTVTNTGSGGAFDAVFTDLLETGLTFVPNSFKFNGAAQPDPNLVTGFSIGTIAEGATATLEFKVQVNAYPENRMFYTNTGLINYEFTPCAGSNIPVQAATNGVRINFLPVANPDTGTTDQGVPLEGGSVLDNDIGTGITVTSYTQPSHGTVSVNSNGTYLYSPDPSFTGPTDVFNYTITDIFGNTASTTVTITINTTTALPVANDDSGITQVNTPLITGSVLDNDFGNPPLSVVTTTETTAQGGRVTFQSNGNYTYIPPLNFVGFDTFPYTMQDTNGNQASATVTIQIYQYLAPIANPDEGTTSMNVPFIGPSVLDNDMGDGLTIYSYTQGSAGGTVVMNPDGTYVYTPPLNFVGVDTFQYAAIDVFGNTAIALVTITVLPTSPTLFSGIVETCKLLNRTEYILNATWSASPSPTVVAYNIYFSGTLVRTVSSNSPLEYRICLPSRMSAGRYQITALDQSGLESARVNIRVNYE